MESDAYAMHHPDWADDASCASGHDPEIFYPRAEADFHDAKAICARCPVINECAKFAIDSGEQHGIWGGLTPDERRGGRRRPASVGTIEPGVGGLEQRPVLVSTPNDGLPYWERVRTLGVPVGEVRQWAIQEDIEVNHRGRVPLDVISMYQQAHRNVVAA